MEVNKYELLPRHVYRNILAKSSKGSENCKLFSRLSQFCEVRVATGLLFSGDDIFFVMVKTFGSEAKFSRSFT